VDEPAEIGRGRRLCERHRDVRVHHPRKAVEPVGRDDGVLRGGALPALVAHAVAPDPFPGPEAGRRSGLDDRADQIAPDDERQGHRGPVPPDRTYVSTGLTATASTSTRTSVCPGRGTGSEPTRISPAGPSLVT
jgi:hypothetical protein